MKQLYKGLIPLCVVLCVCLGLSAFVLRTYWLYDRNDVEVINQLIEENNMQYFHWTDAPETWTFVWWDKSKLPMRIETIILPLYGVHYEFDIVDLSSLSGLKNLDWETHKTKMLILPKNLKSLSCEEIGLQDIDLSGMTELEVMYCGENQLTVLDLSDCTKLQWLNCKDNQLQELILPESAPLQLINCHNNQLKKLDVTGLTSLRDLHCGNNQLTALEIKNLPDFEFVSCDGNQLIELAVENLPKLTHLYCQNNPLEELNIANVPSLEMLHCSEERGRISLSGGVELLSIDYPSRMVTVKAEPPKGKYLGGITGLPERTEIIDNTATFQLTWSVVDLTPRYWDNSLK